MSLVYVDSSVVVGIGLREPTAVPMGTRLAGASQVFAHPLLEAEVRSTCRREARPVDANWLRAIKWVEPSRSLADEMDRVLNAGYVRGADCWHLAVALYIAPVPRGMTFLTLDARQRAVAKNLGFRV